MGSNSLSAEAATFSSYCSKSQAEQAPPKMNWHYFQPRVEEPASLSTNPSQGMTKTLRGGINLFHQSYNYTLTTTAVKTSLSEGRYCSSDPAGRHQGKATTCRHVKMGLPSQYSFWEMLLWWGLSADPELGYRCGTNVTASTSENPILFHEGDVNPPAAQQCTNYPGTFPPTAWSSPSCSFLPKIRPYPPCWSPEFLQSQKCVGLRSMDFLFTKTKTANAYSDVSQLFIVTRTQEHCDKKTVSRARCWEPSLGKATVRLCFQTHPTFKWGKKNQPQRNN